ncbi:MAG: protein kinase [Nannocystaceae bacterium]
MSSESPPDPTAYPSAVEAGQALGRYVVERPLASGGMGEVWLAQDQQLQRRVAIKLMRDVHGSTDGRLERFEHEARLVARLQHPNVVRVYDYGRADGATPYIVMELLEGEDLRAVLQRSSRLSVAALVPVVVQAAKGLHAAHRAGIIHHDLKPANLFVVRQGSERIVKVLDFGIATLQRTESRSGGDRPAWAGSPAYMSPEQLRMGHVDHRTDQWSLAVVAYQALTGVAPFGSASAAQTAKRVLEEPPAPPSRHVATLPAAVDAFFRRALAVEPSARFSSTLELAAAFSALDRRPRDRLAVVLVVDDGPELEERMRERFCRQIQQGRYELLFARDGQGALDQLAERPDVDVVLTDLSMPGMDGLTLLDRLHCSWPALRAVVLTAYGDTANIRAAMNAGAFDFLTKPVDFEDLEATLNKALREVAESRRALRSIEDYDALRLFVDDALMERLLPVLRISSEVSGDTIDASIASIDVWGTRRRIEEDSAAEVFGLLNRSFDVIVPIVNAWRGVVVRFAGDSVVAMFEGEDHLLRAADACFAVREAISELRDGDGRELRAVGVCIGLDSGAVLAGSVGSRAIHRLDYTVLGAPVARALALERRAGRSQILVRQELARQLDPSFVSRAMDGPIDGRLGVVCNVERRRLASHVPPPGLTETEPIDELG